MVELANRSTGSESPAKGDRDGPTPAHVGVEFAPLRVAGLAKSFGRYSAVESLDFQVAAGEVVALWGPNGAGKTTALKCIVGCLPCQGEVAIAGRDALRHGKEARRSVGYVPQEVAFHDDLTIGETTAFYARLKRVPLPRAEELLARLGLAEHAGKRVGALSGGLRQRLALALALLGDPPLLLLDEPTSNLDAAGREQVLRLLADLRERGTAILIASHRLEEIEALADRVLVLERGRIAFTCSARQLARRLGLRLSLRLRVDHERREEALAVLQSAGVILSSNGASTNIGTGNGTGNGSGIKVDVLPSEKVVPIRLLEQAGIAVVDFSIEDGTGIRSEEDR